MRAEVRRGQLRVVATILLVLATACGGDASRSADTSSDGGPGNPGPSDAGPGDAGPSDAGPSDAGPSDAGPSDGGIVTPSPGDWAAGVDLPVPRQEHVVLEVAGEIWLLGGFDDQLQVVDTVDIYDPGSARWRSGPPLPEPMHHLGATVSAGAIYVLGYLVELGFSERGGCYVLDPGSTTWRELAPLPPARARGASGAALVDGQLYVAGGFRQGSASPLVDRYDPSSNTWTSLADLPRQLDHLVVANLRGTLYVAGGRNRSIGAHTPRTFRYDRAADSWSDAAPMPTSRAGAAGVALDGRLYVFGGEGDVGDPEGVFDESEVYDPLTDRWEVLAPMRTKKHGMGAAAVDGLIYIPGGAQTEGFGADAVMDVFSPPQ